MTISLLAVMFSVLTCSSFKPEGRPGCRVVFSPNLLSGVLKKIYSFLVGTGPFLAHVQGVAS